VCAWYVHPTWMSTERFANKLRRMAWVEERSREALSLLKVGERDAGLSRKKLGARHEMEKSVEEKTSAG